MRELETVLPTLQPSAGGLARLQRAVTRKKRKPARRWAWLGAGASAAVVLAVALWLGPQVARWQQADALTRALGQALQTPRQGIEMAHGAALELPSGQDNVRLYLVQTE